MFCPNCGQQAGEGAAFCTLCGERLPAISAQVEAVASLPMDATMSQTQISPGYSQLAFHPELLAAVEKGRQSARKYWRWLIPMPLLFLTIAGLLSDDVGLPLGMTVGGIISLLIGIFYIYDGYSQKHDKPWDGVVVKKYKQEYVKQTNDKYDNHIETQTHVDYHLVFRTAAGEQKEIVEHDNQRRYYDYFREGDYVRYHPQLNNFYEKYDKSHDKYLICPVCGKESKVKYDRCKYCHNILVK